MLQGKWITKTSSRGYRFRVYRSHWLVILGENIKSWLRRTLNRWRNRGNDEPTVVPD